MVESLTVSVVPPCHLCPCEMFTHYHTVWLEGERFQPGIVDALRCRLLEYKVHNVYATSSRDNFRMHAHAWKIS